MADYSLSVKVTADDKASAVFKKIKSNVDTFKSDLEGASASGSSSMNKLGQSMQSVGDKMASTGKVMSATVTAPIVGLGVASAKAAVDFEEAFTGVRKTVDTTEENFEKLSEGIKQMATETASTKTEIAAVMEVAGQLGVEVGKDGETIMDFTRTMIQLGDTTNLSAEEAATALAHFTNITGVSNDKVSNLGSAIVDLGNNFATDEASIVNMSTRLASAGTIAGLTSTDILALSTAMSSVGIQAEAGGTAMSQTLAALSSEVANFSAGTENSLDRIAEIAGMSAKDFAAQWESKHIEALQAFITGLGKLGDKGENATLVLDELGMSGIRQSNMLQSLALASNVLGDAINTSSTAFEQNTALSAEAEKRYGTTASQMSQLKEEFTNCAVTIGEMLIPFLKQGMAILSSVTQAFNSLSPATKEAIVKILAITAAVGPLLLIGGKLISGIGSILTIGSKIGPLISGIQTAVTAIGGGLKVLWGILMANPITLVIAAIAALVAGFIYLWNNCEEFRQFWIDLWEGIKEVVSTVVNAIGNFLSEAWSGIKSVASKAWSGIKSVVGSAWEGIKSTTSSVIGTIKEKVSTGWNNVKEGSTTIWNAITTKVGDAWSAIKSNTASALDTVKSAISNGLENAKSNASSKLDAIKSTFTNIFEGIKSHLSGIVSWLKGIFDFHWELPHISLPHFSITGSFSLNPPSIPHISVDWYKSAYEQAMVFNTPTVFGATGFGDGNGGEVVVGEEHLMDMIRAAVAGSGNNGGGDTIIPVYIGQERIDEIVLRANNRQALLSGGR